MALTLAEALSQQPTTIYTNVRSAHKTALRRDSAFCPFVVESASGRSAICRLSSGPQGFGPLTPGFATIPYWRCGGDQLCRTCSRPPTPSCARAFYGLCRHLPWCVAGASALVHHADALFLPTLLATTSTEMQSWQNFEITRPENVESAARMRTRLPDRDRLDLERERRSWQVPLPRGRGRAWRAH